MSKASEEHPEVHCRLVAHEVGFGERLDELIVGTPSLTIVNILLMLLRIMRALLYWNIWKNVYIHLLQQDLRFGRLDGGEVEDGNVRH